MEALKAFFSLLLVFAFFNLLICVIIAKRNNDTAAELTKSIETLNNRLLELEKQKSLPPVDSKIESAVSPDVSQQDFSNLNNLDLFNSNGISSLMDIFIFYGSGLFVVLIVYSIYYFLIKPYLKK